MKKNILILLLIPFILFAQEYDRNILVEVLTNSHCVLCPAAHSAIDSYLSSSQKASRVKLIYYHMNFPYPDDQLNVANTQDAAARNSFYGPFSGTPQTFFDGTIASTNYSQWSGLIDNRLAVKSPINIKLTGIKNENTLNIAADISVSQNYNAGDLTIQFILVENVNYFGRNGISYHKNVMRLISGSSNGKPITSVSQKINSTILLSPNYIKENLGIVVFVQKNSTREVVQSEFISYSAFTVTDVSEKSYTVPSSFTLHQNYPNPFNPTTLIKYELPEAGNISLKVYDILGNVVATLVNDFKSEGVYNVTFNGTGLSSGIYFYELKSGSKSRFNKMLLLK